MNFGKVRISILVVLLVTSINLFAQDTTGTVDFDINTLHDMNQITISLSDNTSLVINKESVEDFNTGEYVWTGTVVNHPEGTAIISVGSGIATGIIETLEKVWDVKISASAPNPITQIPNELLGLSLDENPIDSLIFKNSFDIDNTPTFLKGGSSLCGDASNGLIDVLVVYTQEAANIVDGAIKEEINKAIKMANKDFDNSVIPWQYNLVGTSLVNSSHIVAGDDGVERIHDTLFGRLVPNPNNNFFNDVHELRDTTKADLVLLMVDFGNGEARALLNIANPEPEKAYAIMDVGRVYDHTFSHELGHVLGAHHDRYVRSDNNGYNYGFINCDSTNWRTIMAYPDACIFTSAVKGVFSSNLIEYNNQAIGDEVTDNRRIIMEGAETAACYRDSSSIDLNQGLVAHYPFDGNANDVSGNGNNGTENGGMTYTTGVSGQAASFDGIDDFIFVNDSNTLPSTAITISFWVNRSITPPTPFENYVSKEHSFQTYLRANGFFESGLYNGATGLWDGYSVNGNVSLNQWVNYSFSFDNTTKIAKSYVNGVLLDTTVETDVNAYLRTSTEPMYIGRNGSASVHYINGLMDELRIYNRALSNSEVQEIFSLQPVDLNAGLVAHYPFDGNANDVSGNGNNGTENGSLTYVTSVSGQAASFDGVDDEIILGDALLPTGLNDSMSVSLFLKLDNLTDSRAIFSQYNSTNSIIGRFHITQKNGNILWVFMGGSDSNNDGWIEYNLTSTNFLHVVIIKNNKNISLYVDKSYVGSFETDVGILNINTILGSDSNGGNSNYKGIIDDLRIYNRAINQSEIQELYNLPN